jgi:uncharacterized protein YbjT (DUF2867 family)
MKKVVVTGIGGLQQTAIAAAFRAAGWTVGGTSRTAGVGVVVADLESGAGLTEAFQGADVVAFTLPQDHREGVTLRMAKAVVQAASRAGVGRIVLNTAARIDEASPLGVFAAMRAARDVITAGPVPAVVLQPIVYMDNLLAPWSLPGILAGTLAYPAPEDARIAWLSHRSLADAVVAAATLDVAGQGFAIGGAAALSGADLTATLARHLGHPVGYFRIPLADFAAGLNQTFGAPAGDRIAELYSLLEAHPGAMADGAEGMARLGVVPETFDAFVARNHGAMAA